MELFKRIKKAKLRKRKLDLILKIKYYSRSGINSQSNKEIRNDIVRNHYTGCRKNRKKWLTMMKERSILLNIKGSSKRVKDILERL
jgi:hypothetical protein